MINIKENEDLSRLNHSCAHLLAQAVKHLYPNAKFWVGPVIEDGFYYDIDLGDEVIKEEDLPKIEKEMKRERIVKWGPRIIDLDIIFYDDLVLDDEEIINNNYLMFDSQTMKQMYDLDDHYKITKNDKHTYFKEEGLYFDLYQLNTLKAKINKNQRECYFQFSNEVYNDAKERLTKKGDAYRLIEGVDHIQYITNDQLKTIYLKW